MKKKKKRYSLNVPLYVQVEKEFVHFFFFDQNSYTVWGVS